MAKKIQHVWGLEIGQSSLKALRCHMEGDEVVTDVFDFVEYPKILSQPEAEPEMLIADALEQFISRNDLKGTIKIGVSVPGQSGLAKFFKPPPVEVKKIADIVKYEAKQQIPFDLNDVIWDFQQMEGAQIEDGYALESEVGLFAMKKEAVFRALKPFRDKTMDIDLVQLAPMSIYNMIAHERFAERMATETFDPDHPQKSTVVLSMGTDASDLIVTNGFRVWQRSIPIGGNHFTRQLTKDLKLTFAKAEHLKRNAMQADDPKLVFQAMRPVFNDMVTEIQRSLNFFKTLNKKSELESMVLLGNTAKLPGLQQFLNKNLGMDVEVLDKFPRLTGNEVLGSQAFKENSAAFGVVYGMCLQLMQRGPMKTNLLPRQIVIDRVVRMKKPWTVGALSILLVGMVANHAFNGLIYGRVRADIWKDSENAVTSVKAASDKEKSTDTDLKGKIALYKRVGEEVSKGAQRRVMVLELYKTIEASMGRDPELMLKSPIELPFKDRKDFHITRVEQKYFEKLEDWYKPEVKKSYLDDVATRKQLGCELVEKTPAQDPDPAGAGWVIEIRGYHFYNNTLDRGFDGDAHIKKYFINFFETGKVTLLVEGQEKELTMPEMGIKRPVLVYASPVDVTHRVPNPDYLARLQQLGMAPAPGQQGMGLGKLTGMGGGLGKMSGTGMGMGVSDDGEDGGGGGGSNALGGGGTQTGAVLDADGKPIPKDFDAPRMDFIVQFAWKPRFDTPATSAAAGVRSQPAPAAAAAEPAATGLSGGD